MKKFLDIKQFDDLNLEEAEQNTKKLKYQDFEKEYK